MNSQINDLNGIQIPVPQKKDDGTIKIGELTAEEIFKEIHYINDDGYSADSIIATTEKLYNVEEKGFENLEADDREIVQTVAPEYCVVELYALTDNVWITSLTFDTEGDAFLTDMMDQLNRYKSMVMHERGKAMQNPEYKPSAIPSYSISFIPYTLGGFGVATFSDPIDYYKTLEDDGKCGIHILFSNETVNFEQVSLTEDELVDVQADVIREEQEKMGKTYNSSF